ncbi:hypothetical protein BDV12DRAFT_190383 [Aspergillus spectabilis]
MSFTHEDYTVAWICALPLEMAAAKFMLDQVHPLLPQPKADHNSYTLGNVGGHNVVVACLPSGIYGTTSAAIVLAHMLPTFTSLRFALMVGIGGGVPSKSADIRLGDVVVSMPNAACGGVIQYDYGKTLHDGHFQRTGSLNKPPQYLLTAVSQLRSDYMFRDTMIKTSEIHQKNPKILERFSRPDNDWLFNPDYNHESDSDECSACAQTQLVDRVPRESNEPLVHYGLIASGNQVMKNARIRDSVARELEILCFEMEAAGLMDQLPCLVIRGICDYCDSHKHKKWQGYAALTAAAYTRALLEVVSRQSYEMTYNRKTTRHWMVPFMRNSRFVGRQNEIDRLEELITHSRESTKSAICGLGGIGKTQIALELAYRIRDKTSEYSIFWIPCRLRDRMTDLEPAEVKEQVKAYLSQYMAGKWLLIFDNADDMEMWTKGSPPAPPLKNIIPQRENGHVLFTSRNKKLAVKLASPNVVSIPEDLLQDNHATTKLLEQLGFLPLAISQAAAYINEYNICLSDYLSLLGEQESSAIEMLSEEFEDDARYAEIQNPVTATWIISFLQIQQMDEIAVNFLSFMACINPRDIPESILPPAPSAKKRLEALGLLKAYCFISEHDRYNSFSLHRLVHLVTRNWLRGTGALKVWIDRAAGRLNNTFPDNGNANRELWGGVPTSCTSSRIGRCLQSDGRYNEAQSLVLDVLKIRVEYLAGETNIHGPEHPNTLTSFSQLGSVLARQGKYEEAEAMHRRALGGREKVLGVEHPDTLTSKANIASTYRSQGRLKEAEELGIHVMEIRKQKLNPQHPDTLASMAELAYTWNFQGKSQDALALMEECFKVRSKVLGPNHPLTASSSQTLSDWKAADSNSWSSYGRRKFPYIPTQRQAGQI